MRIEAKRGSSKSSLFLMELMIAILFFSVASAGCIQLFVRAHLTSQSSGELNMAVLHAQSAAEVFRATDGDPTRMIGLVEGAIAEAPGLIAVYYNGDWVPEQKGPDSVYRLKAAISGEALAVADISVEKLTGGELFAITTKDYTPVFGDF